MSMKNTQLMNSNRLQRLALLTMIRIGWCEMPKDMLLVSAPTMHWLLSKFKNWDKDGMDRIHDVPFIGTRQCSNWKCKEEQHIERGNGSSLRLRTCKLSVCEVALVKLSPSCMIDALNFPCASWGTSEGQCPKMLACGDPIPRIFNVLKLNKLILTFAIIIKNAPAYVCL
jgi:hypothetical protein